MKEQLPQQSGSGTCGGPAVPSSTPTGFRATLDREVARPVLLSFCVFHRRGIQFFSWNLSNSSFRAFLAATHPPTHTQTPFTHPPTRSRTRILHPLRCMFNELVSQPESVGLKLTARGGVRTCKATRMNAIQRGITRIPWI